MHHIILLLLKLIFKQVKANKQASRQSHHIPINQIPVKQLIDMLSSEIVKLKNAQNDHTNWQNQLSIVIAIQKQLNERLNFVSDAHQELRKEVNDMVSYIKMGGVEWPYIKKTLDIIKVQTNRLY